MYHRPDHARTDVEFGPGPVRRDLLGGSELRLAPNPILLMETTMVNTCDRPGCNSPRAPVSGSTYCCPECRYANFILGGCGDYRKPDPVLIALIVLEESGLRREREKVATDRAAR